MQKSAFAGKREHLTRKKKLDFCLQASILQGATFPFQVSTKNDIEGNININKWYTRERMILKYLT